MKKILYSFDSIINLEQNNGTEKINAHNDWKKIKELKNLNKATKELVEQNVNLAPITTYSKLKSEFLATEGSIYKAYDILKREEKLCNQLTRFNNKQLKGLYDPLIPEALKKSLENDDIKLLMTILGDDGSATSKMFDELNKRGVPKTDFFKIKKDIANQPTKGSGLPNKDRFEINPDITFTFI